jgi:hypothetical protein
MNINYQIMEEELDTLGNWAGPKDLFPRIEVDQETAVVTITYLSICNKKRGQYGTTHEHVEELSADGQVLRITGMTGLRNDRRRTGGRQKFCYFVFFGDTGHLYTHRATASKGWLTCQPDSLLKRLRKFGIGADKGVLQQGDYLLKPANGQAYPDAEFLHETMGSGHHKFETPVLYATGPRGRQYKITEPTRLLHEAVDGLQHPTIVVPVGTWIVGTTSNGLSHSNKRD